MQDSIAKEKKWGKKMSFRIRSVNQDNLNNLDNLENLDNLDN